jgi:azurin
MWPAVAFLGLALQAPDAAPARLIPPAPPADIAALVAADPAADAAVAARMLRENGVPAEKRMAAAMAIAKAADRSPVLTVAEAIVACGGTCGGTRDLADLLAGMHDAAAADPAALALLEKAAGAPDDPLHLAACRAIAAMPAERRPAAFRDLSVRTVAIKAVPGAMQYDVKEIKAKPGEVLEITLANGDTMQHNLLVVLPGKMAEVGVAGDRMGETAAGKARHFVPDSPAVIAVMGLVDPGATGRMFLAVPRKPGTYNYVCTYPGHWRMMNGKLRVVP